MQEVRPIELENCTINDITCALSEVWDDDGQVPGVETGRALVVSCRMKGKSGM
jgi:hypothetical protein